MCPRRIDGSSGLGSAFLQALFCADRRFKGNAEARPQQMVWIGEFNGNLGRLRCRIELVGAGDETPLVRIIVASRQDEAKFTPRGSLLNARKCFAALKISGGRRVADHMNRIQLDDGGKTALIARLL